MHRLGVGAEAIVLAKKLKNKQHIKVLHALAQPRIVRDDFLFSGFVRLMELTGLERRQVRRAARHLARMGLAVYSSGLWSEDGDPAGAGYAATMLGATVSAILEEGDDDH